MLPLRFGPFALDTRSGDLLRHGIRIHLPEQAFQILLLLLEHPGEVVLRSEMRQRLWPDDTVVDFDQSINSALKRLRNALGEEPGTNRYIETISKRGYRFIGEIIPEDAVPEATNVRRYRLLEQLPEGEGGPMYRAENLELGRQVAVKILPIPEGETPESVLDRYRQKRAALGLLHPNICTIYGLEDFDGRPGMVMELVAGETLEARLQRGPLSAQDSLRIALQTISALAEGHAVHTIHGDLNSRNIMLTKNGIKVLAFGLSNAADGQTRNDISAFGQLLYEMLTAKPLPTGAGREDFREFPHAIAQFLSRCLSSDPQTRWPSVAAAQTCLEEIGRKSDTPLLRSKRTWLLAAIAVACAIGIGIYLESDQRAKPYTRAVPLTTLQGQQNFPAFSPDGEKVAFSWVGPPRQDGLPAMNIYVKSILNGETLQITKGPTDDRYPAWSPDGREIAFMRTTPKALSEMVVPAGGGTERKLADVTVGFAWSPDGKEIAYVAPYPPAGNGGIMVRTLKTGQVRQLTSPQPYGERWVAWSPDGKQIAFTRNMPPARELFVIASQGGEPRQLTFDHQINGGVAWTPDSRELIFDSNRKTGGNLWRILATGGTPEPVASMASHPAFPSVSLHGNRLIYADYFVDSNIWQYQLPGKSNGLPSPNTPPTCLLCSTVEDDSPRFSPDGRKIVFVSWRTGSEELWTANSDGHAPKQLTFLEGRSGSPRWSPDGQWVAFDSRASGNSDIYVIRATGGTPRRLTTETSLEIQPSWSHDGLWIYFVSDRGGQSHIWKAPFAGGSARQVTSGDGGESQESPDGNSLYYFRRLQSHGMWRIPLDGGLEEAVPELTGLRRTRAWTIRPEGIYFYEEINAKSQIRIFHFATHQITTLLTLDHATPSNFPGLDISPDGRKLLYTQVDNRVNGLMLIGNFR